MDLVNPSMKCHWSLKFFRDLINLSMKLFWKFPKFSQKILLRIFFHFEKKSHKKSEHLCRSEIYPGIQKSYLENQAISHSRYGGRNVQNRLKITFFWGGSSYTKKLDSWFHVFLNSSADFLSVIFGFLGKFRIDLGGQKNCRNFFSRWKNYQNIQHLDTFETPFNL